MPLVNYRLQYALAKCNYFTVQDFYVGSRASEILLPLRIPMDYGKALDYQIDFMVPPSPLPNPKTLCGEL